MKKASLLAERLVGKWEMRQCSAWLPARAAEAPDRKRGLHTPLSRVLGQAPHVCKGPGPNKPTRNIKQQVGQGREGSQSLVQKTARSVVVLEVHSQ